MNLRFLAIWIVLSVVADAVGLAVLSTPPVRRVFPASESLTVLLVIALPIAQWIALAASGVRWGREWALATVAGGVFATVLLNVVQSPYVGIRLGGRFFVTMSLTTAASTILFRTAALRRHSSRFAVWLPVGVAVWTTESVARLALTGAWFSGPISWPWSLTITAVTALIEGLAMTWIVLNQTDRSGVRAAPDEGSGWLWFEWTTMASIGVMLIIGATAPLEASFRGQPGWGAVIGRPLFAAVAGVVIGGGQWLLLRNRLALSPGWIGVSVAAIAGPSLAILLPIPLLGVIVFYGWLMAVQSAVGMAVVGAWFGACQWFVLRRHVRHAYWWIPATSLAWSTFALNRWPTSLSFQTVGFVAGAISGLAMIVLLKSPKSELPLRAR